MYHEEAIHSSAFTTLVYFEEDLKEGNVVKLIEFCWYNLSLHFGLRCAEVQTRLKKYGIALDVDNEGKEFPAIQRDFLSKNCRKGLKAHLSEGTGRLQDPVRVKVL